MFDLAELKYVKDRFGLSHDELEIVCAVAVRHTGKNLMRAANIFDSYKKKPDSLFIGKEERDLICEMLTTRQTK